MYNVNHLKSRLEACIIQIDKGLICYRNTPVDPGRSWRLDPMYQNKTIATEQSIWLALEMVKSLPALAVV
jgi:hypothetical protein